MAEPPDLDPRSPHDVRSDALRPSRAFQVEVLRMFAALSLFVLVYILLMGAAIALAGAAGSVGFFIISVRPSLVTIMLGLGLIGMGLMVVVFLLKFLFARFRPDESGTVKISGADQPELVDFVRRVAHEAGAPLPKKIVLAPEVNAAVYFDSTFLSMFLPVRRNLRIGFGLVNALNLGEFKAVLAHEFGHFSQKSMRLGSYAYTANRIIFNLLFENTSYGKALEAWASFSKYFAIFAHVTILIVQGIQWVLRKLYVVVQKANMALSREMEFHADAVAASVAGSEQLVASLYRLEAADVTFSTLNNSYQAWAFENARPDNAYAQHRELLVEYAENLKIPLEDGLPQVSGSSPRLYPTSRILVKDQWSSHPSTPERERHLNGLGFVAARAHEPAWTLFRDAPALQRQMTLILYPAASGGTPSRVLDAGAFLERRRRRVRALELPPLYRGYFDFRRPELLDFGELTDAPPEESARSLEEILNDESVRLTTAMSVLGQDLAWLDAIVGKRVLARSFEFDGTKYRIDEAPELLRRLQEEWKEKGNLLAAADRRLFCFFLGKSREASKTDEFLACVREFTAQQKRVNEICALSGAIREKIDALSACTPGDAGATEFVDAILTMETSLKSAIRAFLVEDRDGTLLEEVRTALETFVNGSAKYLSGTPAGTTRNVSAAEEEIEYECSDCGTTVNPGMNACPHCGANLREEEFVCADCGKSIQRGQETCPHCGAPLEWDDDGWKGGEELTYQCLQCGAVVAANDVECQNCGRVLLADPPDGKGVPAPGEVVPPSDPEARGELAFVQEDFQNLFNALENAKAAGPLILRLALKRLLAYQVGLLERLNGGIQAG